jgi:thiol-disulfide isomerase/thioredoxin
VISRRSTLIILVAVAAASAVTAADVETITHGREVDLEDHLVPNKHVLFDFYADWCGPCRALEPHLMELAERFEDRLAIRKVDVINWDSAVARQYRLSSIPYLVLYGPDGSRIAAGDAGSVLGSLDVALGGGISTRPGGGGSIPLLIPLLAGAALLAAAVAAAVRRRAPATESTVSAAASQPVDTVADPRDPAIWFALLQGSLEGPFTRRHLEEMVRRGDLDRTSEIRRKGDAEWTRVDAVLD